MGAIYQGVDRENDATVAIKVMREPSGPGGERFAREARVLAELRHEAIVRYVAHGTTPEGEAWLAMDWLEGEDLHTRLQRGALTVDESITLVRRVADALALAHARGVIHRDVKPSNLFLVDGALDRVMVLDFGVAQLGAATFAATRTGAVIGTPGYMAPEQARGDSSIDASVDVFALGCVLFECITGRPVFAAEHIMAVLAKILFEDAPRVRTLCDGAPENVDTLVARMLSKNARERPQSGGELRFELDELGATTSAIRSSSLLAPAISAGELRVVSVVMAAGGPKQEAAVAPTLLEEDEGSVRERVRAAAEPYGARVEQLADGTLVAVVASRGSATDQAAHAAGCALAIRRVLAESPMVLATGRAIVARRLPLGEVIDRAAGLLRGATFAGGIRLDDVTGGLLDLRFDVGGDNTALVLRGERERVDTTRTLLGRPTPFVGRDRELASLHAMLAEVSDESVARVAMIVGAPGSGKSRVRQEFLTSLASRNEPVEIWTARGDPMSAGSPFGMLAQLMRRASGILDGEPLGVRQRKIVARVARHADEGSAQRIQEFLGELVGAPFDDAGSVQLRAARHDAVLMGDQIRRAWEDLLAGVCRQKPLLVVLEDLHWGDLPTIKSIEGALRFLRDSPLMVLAFARPEVHLQFPAIWMERGVQETRLGELPRRASERLVKQVLGDNATREIVTRIVERCDGNPFNLEELIRAVAAGRGDALPDTVLAMVQSRLEALPPDARHVLRAGSVFGGAFWYGGVETLLGGARRAPELRAWLSMLCESEVITAIGAPRFPGETEYSFRSALVRDAAYSMLTEEDRRLGHALAGGWLESAGEQDAVLLAEHFERGGVESRAVGLWRAAAAAAVEGNDFEGAIVRGERSVACGADRAGLGEVRAIQALAHSLHGRPSQAKECAMQAMELLTPDSESWWLAARRLANACLRLGHSEAIPAIAARLTAAIGERGTSISIASLEVLAECLCFSGRYDLADGLFEVSDRARPHEIESADEGCVAIARAIRASVDGDPSAALAYRQAAVAAFERAGRLRSSCHEAANVGAVLNELGAYSLAESTLTGALHAAERMDLRIARLVALNNLGWSCARLGRLEDALMIESEAVALSIAQHDRLFESGSRTLLARILALRGELDRATQEALLGVALADASPPQRPGARAVLASVHLQKGNPHEALAEAKEALAELVALGGVEEGESLVLLMHAESLHATGDVAGALAALTSARTRLLERANKIRDNDWRTSFLESVAENARTLELERAWRARPDS